jgi:hypothetical protein
MDGEFTVPGHTTRSEGRLQLMNRWTSEGVLGCVSGSSSDRGTRAKLFCSRNRKFGARFIRTWKSRYSSYHHGQSEGIGVGPWGKPSTNARFILRKPTSRDELIS